MIPDSQVLVVLGRHENSRQGVSLDLTTVCRREVSCLDVDDVVMSGGARSQHPDLDGGEAVAQRGDTEDDVVATVLTGCVDDTTRQLLCNRDFAEALDGRRPAQFTGSGVRLESVQ